jgi:hypothetical protein
LLCLEHTAVELLAVANPIITCASHSDHLAPHMCGDKRRCNSALHLKEPTANSGPCSREN